MKHQLFVGDQYKQFRKAFDLAYWVDLVVISEEINPVSLSSVAKVCLTLSWDRNGVTSTYKLDNIPARVSYVCDNAETVKIVKYTLRLRTHEVEHLFKYQLKSGDGLTFDFCFDSIKEWTRLTTKAYLEREKTSFSIPVATCFTGYSLMLETTRK